MNSSTTSGSTWADTFLQRRVTVRFPCPPNTSCRLLEADDYSPRWGWVLNLSTHGIGLHLATALEPGLALVIELKPPQCRLPVTLSARVVHATARGDGSWMIGCAFFHPLEDRTLQALLESERGDRPPLPS